jgi:hypothetical protein
MNPLNTDNYPIASVDIGPASPIPYIVTGIAVVLAVGLISYFAFRIIRKRRATKPVKQSQS